MTGVQISNENSKSNEQVTYQQIPENKWYLRWRHFAAYIFLFICVLDFAAMPIIYEINDTMDITQAVELSLKFKDPSSQTTALTTFLQKRTWEPLTLKAGGMFFVAFGGILGISAWSRGKEKLQSIVDTK